MGTSVAISAAALASSSAAQSAALAARKDACAAFEFSFSPSTASIQQKQQYAECVQLNYPKPSVGFSEGEILVVKGVIVFLLLALVVGAYRGDGYGGHQSLSDRLGGAFIAVCVAAICLIAVSLIFAAIAFLFR